MEGLVVKVKERSLLFDNIKTVLIILVVLGHALEEISLEHEYGIIRACIYSFHMPAFIFISGYFSGGGYAKVLEPGGIDHSESSRNNQSELIRNSQCTCLAN